MENKKAVIACKDFLVSQETFKLYRFEDYEILKTQPQPEDLASYYKSPDYISHTDSKSTIMDWIYQQVKNYMLGKKLAWIEQYKSKGEILDIGAGTGDFLHFAFKKGWKVSGMEPEKEARDLSEKKGIALKKTTAEFIASTFEVITMWHVLEHIQDTEVQIKELDRLLHKDGILVIAVPNFKSLDALYYKEYWAAYDVPRHLWHFSQDGIQELFRRHGFSLVETKPLKFDAYYVSLLSEKYKNGFKNFPMALWTGFRSNLKAGRTSEYSSLVYVFKKAKTSF